MEQISIHFYPNFSFAIEPYLYETDFTPGPSQNHSYYWVLLYIWFKIDNFQAIQPYSWSPQQLYVYNIKPKLCAKHVLTARE